MSNYLASSKVAKKHLNKGHYIWALKKSPCRQRNLVEHLVNQAVFQWEHNNAAK